MQMKKRQKRRLKNTVVANRTEIENCAKISIYRCFEHVITFSIIERIKAGANPLDENHKQFWFESFEAEDHTELVRKWDWDN